MSSSIVSIEGSSYDLSALVNVNLSYNFEILKHAIEAIVKSQKSQSIKMIDYEDNLRKRDKKLEE